jgi:capsular exopolysaccharide synthesis family protein
MELEQYWRIIRKRLWLVGLLVAVAVASAIYYGRQEVPLYSTSTTLFLNPASPSALLPYEGTGSTESLANTYVEFMRSRTFAALVGQELDNPLSEDAVLKALSTKLVPTTQFFRISATHPDPLQAQDLANTAAAVLIAENVARLEAQRSQIEAQRDPAKTLERQQLVELLQSLQDELAYAGDRITYLQAQISELEAKPPSEETDQQVLDLRGELVRNQSLRVDLYGSLAQAQAALTSASGDGSEMMVDTAVVVDPAPLPKAPQPRHLEQYALLAGAAALVLGVSLAFLLEYLDWTIKTPEELEAVYGLGTLGVIGTLGRNSRDSAHSQELVVLTEPSSPMAESFRALRTNIRFANPEAPLRSLLVTSAGPEEGKTTTAANLAITLAQAGSRVILVDADLRRPRLHRVFDVAREPGFTELMIDQQGSVEAYLQGTEVENLRVMPCGPLPRHPAELLGSQRIVELIKQLEELADYVIFDSPPAATVTDAVVLASRVDGVLHVVLAGGPRREVVLRTKAALEKVGARILGPVLNQVNLSDMGYYHYYYYDYSHEDGHKRKKQSLVRRLLPKRHRNEQRTKRHPKFPRTDVPA